MQVIYSKSIKRVTLQRALVGKFIFYPKRCTLEDILILFDNLLWCQEKCQKDSGFKDKFGLHLKVQAQILKNLNLTNIVNSKHCHKISAAFTSNLESFAYDKRNVLNPLNRTKGKIEIRPSKQPGVLNDKLPPVQYIGVGYRDKGTAKKPWIDGSPSWQEIASTPLEEL